MPDTAPTPEDQAWLDEQLLDARREFPAQVFAAHTGEPYEPEKERPLP